MTVLVLGTNAYAFHITTGDCRYGTLSAVHQYLQNVGGTFYNFAWQYGEMVRLNTAMNSAEIINEAFGDVRQKKIQSAQKMEKHFRSKI